MNSQASYIVHASLILSLCAGIFFFVKKMPVIITEKENVGVCGTLDTSTRPELSGAALQGEKLFMSTCASCHNIYKNATGPGLLGFTERGPWTDRKNVYDWVHNPPAFMAKNKYARDLKKMYGSMMTGFPLLTNEDIDAICEYIKSIK